jgi:hypothetical protein
LYFQKNGFLFLLPAIGVVIQLLYINDLQWFFINWPDPPYCYLFNALNLASGNLELGHIDHPGTTLQVLGALIIRFVHLFRNGDLVADVLSNSEIYLFAFTATITALITVALLFLGIKTRQYANSILIGIYFQLIASASLISSYYIPFTESMLFFAGIGFHWLFVRSFYLPETLNQFKTALFFGLLVGFSIVTKISSIVLAILPFFVLRGLKLRFLYVLSVFAFTLIFAAPMLNKAHIFLNWVINLLTHSGKYGAGEEKVFDLTLFLSNFSQIWREEWLFTTTVIILFLHHIFHYLFFEKTSNFVSQILLGLFVAIVFQVLIVSKHFSYSYLVPVHHFILLIWFFLYQYYKQYLISIFKYYKLNVALLVLACLFFTWRKAHYLQVDTDWQNPFERSVEFVRSLPEKPVLMMGHPHQGSAFKQMALYFGNAYAGQLKDVYAHHFSQLFDFSMVYLPHEDKLFNWNERLFTEDLLQHAEIYLYLRNGDEVITNSPLYQEILNGQLFKNQLIFENEATGEKIFLVETLKKPAYQKKVYQNTFENLINELDSSSFSIIDSVVLSNSKAAFSGHLCVHLSEGVEYAGKFKLNIKPKTLYEISAKFKSEKRSGLVIMQGTDGFDLYIPGVNTFLDNGNWIKNTIRYKSDSTPKEVIIYFWNQHKDDILIDDFEIKQIEVTF